MFVLEYIKKKNFYNKNKEKKIVLETNIADNEELILEKFKEEISKEIGFVSNKENDNERED